MGTGLSDVDISQNQSSRWQKFATVPEEIFAREVQGKTHSCRRLVSISQSCSRKRTSAAPAGIPALCHRTKPLAR
jgi:hypothetical protein